MYEQLHTQPPRAHILINEARNGQQHMQHLLKGVVGASSGISDNTDEGSVTIPKYRWHPQNCPRTPAHVGNFCFM